MKITRSKRIAALVITALVGGVANFVFLSDVAWARCGYYSLDVWPPPSTVLPTNAQIVIEVFSSYGLLAADDARNPRLVSDTDEISLTIVQTYQGEMLLSQVVLQPETPLNPSTVYTLTLEDEEGADYVPSVWNGSDQVDAQWTTGPGPDSTDPVWTSAPTLAGASHLSYGCGPSAHILVGAELSDTGPLQYVADVRRLDEEGSVVVFRVTVEDPTEIGHGMCSGAFLLQPAIEYEIRLGLIDAAGNTTSHIGEPLVGVVPEEWTTPE